MAEIGDIVSNNGTRWVVQSFTGAPDGGRLARLVRPVPYDAHPARLKTKRSEHHESGLTVVEPFDFPIGSTVNTRGGGTATVIELGVSEVIVASRPGLRTRIPKWQLVLENADV